MITLFWKQLNAGVNHKKNVIKSHFKAVWIAIKWKRNKRKWGPNPHVIYQ